MLIIVNSFSIDTFDVYLKLVLNESSDDISIISLYADEVNAAVEIAEVDIVCVEIAFAIYTYSDDIEDIYFIDVFCCVDEEYLVSWIRIYLESVCVFFQ